VSELKDLCGKSMLDGVDFQNVPLPAYDGAAYTEDSQVCRFRLNGTVFLAIEDPNDGYRSSMRELKTDPRGEIGNVFPAIEVVGVYRDRRGSYSAADILELIDTTTGKVVLEIGTDNSDDYYPSFVANFQPENMATNTPAEAQP